MNNLNAIGIDLGGTRVKGVVVDTEGVIFSQYYHSIVDNNWKQGILDTVKALESKSPGDHLIGISAPGIPSAENDRIDFMPGRLQGLEGFVWSELLHRPAHVVNDAVAAMAGEAKFGSAKGISHAIMLTLGTGVGGAILIDGKIYNGAFQKAGHMGHISVNYAGDPDITGMPGSLEDAIGNCTIAQRSSGKYQYTHELLEDVQKGDVFANQIWQLSIQKLAIGIASLTNVLSPERVILGGGITEAADLLFVPLEEYLSRYEWRAGGRRAELVRASFGDMAGALGAAGFAMMKNEIRS
jgi:glucokinase